MAHSVYTSLQRILKKSEGLVAGMHEVNDRKNNPFTKTEKRKKEETNSVNPLNCIDSSRVKANFLWEPTEWGVGVGWG